MILSELVLFQFIPGASTTSAVIALYVVEINIVPSANGVVQLQARPVGTATQVVVKQGSLGFMQEVL